MQTRTVTCNNADEKECLGARPDDSKKCVDMGPHCTECKVTLFGGLNFDGWHVDFAPGKYDTDGLVGRGAKCEEVSSLIVEGRCCHAKLYQYGDFNKKTKGWKAVVWHGKYDQDALEDKGVENNDVSSMKVWVDKRCSEEGHKWVPTWKAAEPASASFGSV